MELRDLKQHLDGRLDSLEDRLQRIEEKQDTHVDRISASETSIKWIQGYIKLGTSILLATLTGLASIVYSIVVGK